MQTDSMILPTIIASLCATGCSLLLVRRGPSRRLRYLTLTVGLMSFSQTASLLHTQGVWTGGTVYVVHVHQSLVAGLSLLAMYLLAAEVYDRNYTDRRLRLTEHELLMAHADERNRPRTEGLLALMQHTGADSILGPENGPYCTGCLGLIQEIAGAWQGLHQAKVERKVEAAAKERLAQALRARLEHELATGHDVVEAQERRVQAFGAATTQRG